MNDFIEEWKSDVLKLQEVDRTLDNDREIAYSKLASYIKKVFRRNGFDTDNVHFSKDGSVIEVTLSDNTQDQINIPRKLAIDLEMNFAVCRRISRNGETELFFKMYPLEED